MRYEGQCHCGAIRFEFETDKPFVPRACRCGFCRRHNARTVSDPQGSAEFALGPKTQRYRFASNVTDFLICPRCGVYVGALAEIEGRLYATLNLNAFDDPRHDLEAVPASYEREGIEARADRRRSRWTPARIETVKSSRNV